MATFYQLNKNKLIVW